MSKEEKTERSSLFYQLMGPLTQGIAYGYEYTEEEAIALLEALQQEAVDKALQEIADQTGKETS